LCAFLSLVGALLAFFGLRGIPNDAPAAPTEEHAPGHREPNPQDDRFIRRFAALSVVTVLGHWGNGTRAFVTLYAVTVVGLSTTEIGLLASLTGVAILAFAVPGGQMCDRFGRKPVLIGGLIVSAAVPVMMAADLAQSFLALAALALVAAIGNSASNP